MLTVDPGKHHCGCCRVIGARVVAAWLHETAGPPIVQRGGREALCEIPQIYVGAPARTRDLIDVAAAAGRVCALHDVRYVRPGPWKGQQQKTAQHRKMLAALDPEERKIVEAVDCAPKLRHNVYDAVCLALWRLGRI